MRLGLPFLRRRATPPPDVADPISLFESEAGLDTTIDQASVRAAVRAIVRGVAPMEATADAHVTVDAIIARKTQVLWLEAVAIVHGASQEAAEDGIPDKTGIILTAHGRIRVERAGRPVGVDDLARTLHVLVAGEQIPAALRLFISKWITPADAHTLPDFTKELAYFARPDSDALIRAVYERHLKGATAPVPAIKPVEPPKPLDDKKPKRKLVVPRWAMVTVVALVVAGTATVLLQMWMRSRGGTSPVDALASIASAATSGVSLSGEQAAKTDTELPAPKHSKGLRATSPESPAAQRRADVPSVQPAFAPWLPLGAGTIDFYGRPSLSTGGRPEQGQGAASGATREPTSVAAAPSPDRVYTVNDAEVRPPLMLYPSLPPVLAINGDTNTMEVVVSPEGTVERVRLISVAKRMTDMMLLSGAKTWRFQPASLSGEPVRYRMVVSWSATP